MLGEETFGRPRTGVENSPVSRRRFLGTTLGAVAAAGPLWAARVPRPKVAAIFTYFHYRSHAHVILENFLEPYLFNGRPTDPGVDVVSFYTDQKSDMAAAVASDYSIPIYPTIGEALCLGQSELAVDAVLSIGEHGSYPTNELGQHMYPRKRFFDQIAAVMRRSQRSVPVFNDKHLSYRWDWAHEMVQVADELKIPLMAGSSVPLAQRVPPLELPDAAPIRQAVSIHGGPVESYDCHGLEVLQSLVEARRGSETGVSEVQFLDKQALWTAASQGLWSVDLAKTAMRAGHEERPLQSAARHGILVHYRDGLIGLCLSASGGGTRWHFACRMAGRTEPAATSFYVGPWSNRNLFKALSHAIQHHFIHGQAPYPVQRTLLVTGILEAAMRSRQAAGKPIRTPHLEFAYAPRDFSEMRERGATWQIITDQTPEPKGIGRVAIPDGFGQPVRRG